MSPKLLSWTWIANITNIYRNANVLRTSRIYTAMRMCCKHIQDAAVALLMRRVSIASAKRIYNPRCSAEVLSIYKLIVMLLDGSNTRGLGWAESSILPSTASSVYFSQRGSSPFHRSTQTASDWNKLSDLHYIWCTPSVQSSSQQLPMNCREYAKKSELQKNVLHIDCVCNANVLRIYRTLQNLSNSKVPRTEKTLLRKLADRCECLLSNTSMFYEHWDVSRISVFCA